MPSHDIRCILYVGKRIPKRLLRGGVREQRRAHRLHAFAEDAGPDSGDVLDRDGDLDAEADTDAAGDEYADAEGEEDLENAEDLDEMDFECVASIIAYPQCIECSLPSNPSQLQQLHFCMHS